MAKSPNKLKFPITKEDQIGEIGRVRKLKERGEKPRIRGLGDVIAKVTKAIGIEPCDGCKDRQEWLNKKVPFKLK